MISVIFVGSTFIPSDDINVREIQWTLLQFDISFYSVLVHFCESSKTLNLNAHYVRKNTIISTWELALPGSSEIIQVICWESSLAE